jgi:hypothetical protein
MPVKGGLLLPDLKGRGGEPRQFFTQHLFALEISFHHSLTANSFLVLLSLFILAKN